MNSTFKMDRVTYVSLMYSNSVVGKCNLINYGASDGHILSRNCPIKHAVER
jgi:hypothetical protein